MSKTVTLTGDFTYRMDKSRKRNLPAGWRGEVSDELAAKIEKEGKGAIVSEVAAEEMRKKKTATKSGKATPKKAAVPTKATATDPTPSVPSSDGTAPAGSEGAPGAPAGQDAGGQSDGAGEGAGGSTGEGSTE